MSNPSGATEIVAQRRALIFILSTVTLDAIGIGILIPVIPELILELTGEGLARAAVYGGWLTAVFAVVQFLASPILGSLSDRFGRRPVLLLSLSGFGVSYVLMGFAPALAWLFVAQALTGLFGATLSTAGAFIADITAPSERTRHFGSMAAAFGTGLIIGPASGGLLAAQGTRIPLFVSAGLSLLTVTYGYFGLPESLPAQRRRNFSWHRANPYGALLELRRHAGVSILLLAMLLQRVASQTLPATWPYFTMLVLDWSARDVGYSLAVFGLATLVVQAGLIGRIDRRLGTRPTAALGLSLLTLGYLGIALGDRWLIIACIPLATMGFMSGPALTSLLSRSVPADSQGSLQGVLGSINGLAAVLTPLIMPRLFSFFSSGSAPVHFPGAPYFLGALLALTGVLLVTRVRPRP